MNTPKFRNDAVRIGDTITFLGRSHIVSALTRRNGFGDPIADCADGWSITLDHDGKLAVPTPDARTGVLATGGQQ